MYYPPYHSKYNLIERCWGILESHWNGTLLNSVHTVVEWARTMTWNGTRPVVSLIEKTYDTGVRIAKAAFKAVESRLQRDPILRSCTSFIEQLTQRADCQGLEAIRFLPASKP